jgi:hypothetical protein
MTCLFVNVWYLAYIQVEVELHIEMIIKYVIANEE